MPSGSSVASAPGGSGPGAGVSVGGGVGVGGQSRSAGEGAGNGLGSMPVPYPFPCTGKTQASWSVSYGATAACNPGDIPVMSIPSHLTAPASSRQQHNRQGFDAYGLPRTDFAAVAVRGVIFLSLFAFGSPRGAAVMRSAWRHLKPKY
mmetsp:Transcript_7970/g.21120  ORF Transcript_7970/g.21120 Transcript_7970/m.21120 type:complete len:148 (+) Transcript_7970:78-521(+)